MKYLFYDMLINMRQFLANLWTFELLHFDQLFSSNLQSGHIYGPIINRIYLLENVLCSKNDEIGTEIYLKSLG